MAASVSGPSLAALPSATPLDRCPDCGRPADSRYCPNCGRAIDGLPSGLAGRVARHLWRLSEMGLPIRGHGEKCITRETGGWQPGPNSTDSLQVCPCCERQEYRGAYCSGCGIPTGAADWRSQLSAAQRSQLAALNARAGGARTTAPNETPEVAITGLWAESPASAPSAD